jgi:hypothetical protein
VPNRILRDGILTSESVSMLSWGGEVFYRRLISVVDDHGRFHALPKLIRSACYPLHIDKVSDADIEIWLTECVIATLVTVYQADDGKRYLRIEKFGQQVRSKSKFPEPVADIKLQARESASNCYQEQSSAHLVGDVGVGEVGDVIEGGDGDVGAQEPSRAVQIAVILRRSGIDGANASNPLLIEWAENPRVTNDLLATAMQMVKDRKPTRPGPNYVAPIIKQLLNPQPARASPRSYHDERAETIAALTGRSKDHERPEHDDRIIDV